MGDFGIWNARDVGNLTLRYAMLINSKHSCNKNVVPMLCMLCYLMFFLLVGPSPRANELKLMMMMMMIGAGRVVV